MKKYWQILRKYKGSLAVSPLLVLVAVLCETVQPMYMAKIVDDGVMQRDLSVITEVGTYMVLVSIAGLLVTILNVYISSRASIGFGTDLRESLFNKIQQLSFFDIDRFFAEIPNLFLVFFSCSVLTFSFLEGTYSGSLSISINLFNDRFSIR